MNIFRRLFKIGEAEANSAIDNMEDPIKLTEQGIRDMKQDLDKSLEALAQVKALAIRAKNDQEEFQDKAEEYQSKAIVILKKAHAKQMDAAEADRLAKEALLKKEESEKQVAQAKTESEKFDNNVAQLQKNIQNIKANISKWENELKTLKARVKVSNATKNLNKQMAELDSTGTVSMLERMKEKVAQEEALAEAYGDIANASKSIDDELDKAADTSGAKAEDELEKLKAQLGLDDSKNQG
ncbi:phage shock protein A (PspA) family protein [Leeuwenhoekiella aestuarii]|uniref:Phage shock protein A (PspA) family protein n=1 Tax=Leeuwenhoekiella aestuarii TaxID=2249426 RepID=A0A4Q0NX43_9FLAO|nr:PspA/IM30 family protein [Leeuwenhoekiella aestuarii]RXG16149.1 phage shock protein A (PspA) family protein [Leeuwenhoekiella aestuarii]RXG16843.1 phage shock protein A (PspA) family protein [Leeuwenhoekiella aestuarii]